MSDQLIAPTNWRTQKDIRTQSMYNQIKHSPPEEQKVKPISEHEINDQQETLTSWRAQKTKKISAWKMGDHMTLTSWGHSRKNVKHEDWLMVWKHSHPKEDKYQNMKHNWSAGITHFLKSRKIRTKIRGWNAYAYAISTHILKGRTNVRIWNLRNQLEILTFLKDTENKCQNETQVIS